MGDELERRVRNLHEAPFDLDSVKGTAMKIRTKRRAAVAGGLLAAAAVVVPIAVIDPAQTPSQTATDPVVDPVDPEDPPAAGPALGFTYIEMGSGNAVLHLDDGSRIELPGPDYTGAAVLGDQVAAFRSTEDGQGAVDLVEDQAVTTTYEVRPPVAIAPDGRTIALITDDDELLVLNGEAGEQSFGAVDPDAVLAAFIGNGDCSLETGCHPFLEYGDLEREPFEVNYEGPDTRPVPGALRLNDAADGFLVTAQVSSSDIGSCGGLYDREGGGAVVFETCDSQVLDISPTGDFVAGTDPYGDGLGPTYFSILDRTGDEVARYEVERGFVYVDLAWSDDTHVVASVYQDAQWRVVSLGVDGASEVVLGPVDGTEMLNPFQVTGGYTG
ncbi:hypothetical protein [Nocardioides sp.]|uniref:hypothetical protein n=1 Tax=Nocardioides sp. TaxID=35761 RepID=UPI002B27335C|nr:hypothetical protein [Nocardioides sp.]